MRACQGEAGGVTQKCVLRHRFFRSAVLVNSVLAKKMETNYNKCVWLSPGQHRDTVTLFVTRGYGRRLGGPIFLDWDHDMRENKNLAVTESEEQAVTSDMTTGRPGRHILLFSLPLLAGNVLQQLYSMVDGIIVSYANKEAGVAGVGASSPIILVLTSFFVGIGLGASVLMSQYYGAGDYEKVSKLARTINSVLLPVVIPLSLLGILLAGPLRRLTSVPPGDTFENAKYYMIVILAGLLPSFGFNLNSGILMGLGNSIIPFTLLCVSCALNVVLDLVFVLVFGWGAPGAAGATIISQAVSWIPGTIYINKKYPYMKLKLLQIDVDKPLLKKAIKMGLPTGINQSVFQLGNVFFQNLVNLQGSEFMAGYVAASKIEGFAVLPIQSFATAVTTFVGQNMGRGSLERVRRGVRSGLGLSVAACGLICALVLPFSGTLLGIYDLGDEARRVGMLYITQVFPFFVLLSLMFIMSAVLRGVGQTMMPMIATLISLCIIRIPVAYIFQGVWGKDTMFFSSAIAWAVGAAMVIAYYLTGRWKTKRLIDTELTQVLM